MQNITMLDGALTLTFDGDGSALLTVRGKDPALTHDDLVALRDACNAAIGDAAGRRSSARIEEIESRLAFLESSVRRTAHRINMTAEAMHECARSTSLHPSVKMLADTLAINLAVDNA